MRSAIRPGRKLVACLGAEASRRLTVFLRLNLRRPDRTDVLHEVLVVHEGARQIRLDLDAAGDGVIDGAWLDVIHSYPRMSEIRMNRLDLGFETAP